MFRTRCREAGCTRPALHDGLHEYALTQVPSTGSPKRSLEHEEPIIVKPPVGKADVEIGDTNNGLWDDVGEAEAIEDFAPDDNLQAVPSKEDRLRARPGHPSTATPRPMPPPAVPAPPRPHVPVVAVDVDWSQRQSLSSTPHPSLQSVASQQFSPPVASQQFLYVQPNARNVCPPRPKGLSLPTTPNGECFFESIERVRAFNGEPFISRKELRVMACDWLVVPIGDQDHNAPENTEQRARADLASALKHALWGVPVMPEALNAMKQVAPGISEETDTSSILNTYAVVAREYSFFADAILNTATAWAIGATVGVYRNKSKVGQPIGPICDNLPVYNVRHINENHFEGLVDSCGGGVGGNHSFDDRHEGDAEAKSFEELRYEAYGYCISYYHGYDCGDDDYLGGQPLHLFKGQGFGDYDCLDGHPLRVSKGQGFTFSKRSKFPSACPLYLNSAGQELDNDSVALLVAGAWRAAGEYPAEAEWRRAACDMSGGTSGAGGGTIPSSGADGGTIPSSHGDPDDGSQGDYCNNSQGDSFGPPLDGIHGSKDDSTKEDGSSFATTGSTSGAGGSTDGSVPPPERQAPRAAALNAEAAWRRVAGGMNASNEGGPSGGDEESGSDVGEGRSAAEPDSRSDAEEEINRANGTESGGNRLTSKEAHRTKGRVPYRRAALGHHWTVQGQWQLLGFDAALLQYTGRYALKIGSRIRTLLLADPTLVSIAPPDAQRAPDWLPMSLDTISDNDIWTATLGTQEQTLGGYMCTSLCRKAESMMRADSARMHLGGVLSEEDHPAERLANVTDLIRSYNAAGGKCGMCGTPFCSLAAEMEIDVETKSWTTASKELLKRVWTPQRIYNFKVHQPSNLAREAVCNQCNKMTNGTEQLINPRYVPGASPPSAILTAASYEERYAQAKAWVAEASEATGGPRVVLPQDFHPAPSARERDATTFFTCTFPGCNKSSFRRDLMVNHHSQRQASHAVGGIVRQTVLGRGNILHYVGAGGMLTACWTERPRLPGDVTTRSRFQGRPGHASARRSPRT